MIRKKNLPFIPLAIPDLRGNPISMVSKTIRDNWISSAGPAVDEFESLISKEVNSKFALATIYNTVHAFKKAGHLSEVDVRGKKTYFDTNITNHHHFYDNETSELIDIDASEIVIQKIPKAPNGKKIKNVEVFINLKN